MQVSPRQARKGLAELADSGLARHAGAGEWLLSAAGNENLADGGTKDTAEGPEAAPQNDAAQKLADPTYRHLRAKAGGLERSLREIQGQRDAARSRVAELEAEGRRERRLAVDPDVVALRAELLHAADCGDPGCDRCEAALMRLEEGRARFVTEDELVAQLERARLLEVAARRLLAAQRSRNVGARQAAAIAGRALELALHSDLAAAQSLLATASE